MVLHIVMLEHRRRGHEVVMIHFRYFHLEISQFVEGCIESWQNRIMFVNPLLRFFIHPKVGLTIHLYKLLALACHNLHIRILQQLSVRLLLGRCGEEEGRVLHLHDLEDADMRTIALAGSESNLHVILQKI